MKSNKLFRIASYLLVAAIAVIATLIIRDWMGLSPPPTVNRGPDAGPPTSWSTQLSTAFDAARKETNDPVFIAVHAKPVGGPPDYLDVDWALEGEFLFLNKSSQDPWVYIDINDVRPEQTVRKNDPHFGFLPQRDIKPNLDDYTASLSSVKLSARDVFSLTLNDAAATLRESKYGFLVDAYLNLLPEFPGIANTSPVWSIYYSVPSNTSGPYRIDYLVDANSGAILRRTEEK